MLSSVTLPRRAIPIKLPLCCHYYGKFNDVPKRRTLKVRLALFDYVNRDQIYGCCFEISESDYRSESDNDFEDEEHVVQEVEVNMGYFNFQVEDASTGTDGNMIPVAPKVNLTEDNIEVLEFDSLESDLEDVPENDRRLGLRKLKKKHSSSKFYIGKEFANRDVAKDLIRTHAVERHNVDNAAKAFRAKAKAAVSLRGDVKIQYALLRDYVMELKRCNPDTTVKIDGFREGGRELLGLDGAFMIGQRLNFDLYSNSNFTFITDRQKGLLPALEKLFPHAEHRVFDIIKEASSECIVDWNGADQYRMWEISGIPCKHAIAAIHDMADNGNDVNPVNGRELWSKFDCIYTPTTLLPTKNPSTNLGETNLRSLNIVKENCYGAGQQITRASWSLEHNLQKVKLSNAAGVGPTTHKVHNQCAAGVLFWNTTSQVEQAILLEQKRKSKSSTEASYAAGEHKLHKLQKVEQVMLQQQAYLLDPLKKTRKSCN
ncbi:receptor-like cytoplasmic kinase 176 [Tanacetum coccineum]